MSVQMPPGDRATLERLIDIARRDTGQSRTVADFLLAWWNASSCGGFDIASLWRLDAPIARDCLLLMGWIAQNNHYPDELGFGPQFEALILDWRPALLLSEKSRQS